MCILLGMSINNININNVMNIIITHAHYKQIMLIGYTLKKKSESF